MTLDQLNGWKVEAYDYLAQIEYLRLKLGEVNQKIASWVPDPVEEK